MNDLISTIDKEKDERFKKPWPKLEKGTKLNRILLFVKQEKLEKELTSEQEKQLKQLLNKVCATGSLNKINDVEYDQEELKIISIQNLSFDEDSKKYSFEKIEKKTKSSSKSKSNVERHFNRSKKSDKKS